MIEGAEDTPGLLLTTRSMGFLEHIALLSIIHDLDDKMMNTPPAVQISLLHGVLSIGRNFQWLFPGHKTKNIKCIS